MKLLITLDFPPEVGGIQRYLYDIVRFTLTSDDRVLVGCSRKPRISYKELKAKITWVSTPLSFLNKKLSGIPLFTHFLSLANQIKKDDEITCGNVYAALVPWIASFFMQIRYAVYAYGTEILFLQKKTFRGWILKKVLKRAHVLFSISNYTASLLKETGISAQPTIIPPRVVIPLQSNDIEKIPEKTEQLSEGKIPRILCAGRLVPRKGFAQALEALSLLPSEMQWRCVIAGDGPLGKKLRTFCLEKKIHNRVEFKKALSNEELSKEYSRSSIFVLPGARGGGVEGFGIVLIEAMAHRVPVIAGRTGGVAEVLENGACGILVEPGDVIGLSREIRTLLSDDGIRERLAARAFERVRKYYAW